MFLAGLCKTSPFQKHGENLSKRSVGHGSNVSDAVNVRGTRKLACFRWLGEGGEGHNEPKGAYSSVSSLCM